MRKSLSEASMTEVTDVTFDATGFLRAPARISKAKREVRSVMEWGSGGECQFLPEW